MPVHLSVIIPARNEEKRLPGTLQRVSAFLSAQTYDGDIWVVDSGSTDNTAAIAREFPSGRIPINVLREDRPGKGLAVRTGMLAARGDYRFICDADLSMPIEEVNRFIPPVLQDVDIAIASREVPGAVRYGEPLHRHLIGRAFNLLVRMLAIPRIQDTQCGFKCFSASAAEDLFRRGTLDGWTFDVEILFIALHRGWRIVEVPIPWTYHAGSRLSVLRDSVAMFLDLFRIRYNGLRGAYDRDPGPVTET